MASNNSFSDFFEESNFGETNFVGPTSPDDIFSILENLECVSPEFKPLDEASLGLKEGEEMIFTSMSTNTNMSTVINKSSCSRALQDSETELEGSPKCKRKKVKGSSTDSMEEGKQDGEQRMCHITVERKRRKQMNEQLSILRSLIPSFHVKRCDQASIIGGVVDYINELQLVLQSLESKKQRKVYTESVLSPRFVSSPRLPPFCPRKPPISPRITIPISPKTPQPSSPYKPWLQQQGFLSPTMANSLEPLPSSSSSTSSIDNVAKLVANSKSTMADVEVKFYGSNLLLKTVSSRVHGQACKIISVLDQFSLQILQVNISTIDETMILSFTIKIGIECQLSAEELAHQVLQTFC